MGRPYSITIPGLSGLTTAPFLQIATPAGTGIELLRIELGNGSSVTSAAAVLTAMRRSTASTLPTPATPVPLRENDPSALETGSTTTCAVGTATVTGTAGNILLYPAFNVLSGYLYLPVPEERITVKPSSFLTLQFASTPPADTYYGHVIFCETE